MKRDQLIAVIERADHIIRTLSNKYRDQKGALVFSSPYGQCKLTSDVKEILADFPEMIFESIDKKKAIEFIRTIKSLEGRKKDIHSAQSNQDISSKIDAEQSALKATLDNLEFLDDTFIEIRFEHPNLDLIFEMQKDPLVSQKHTPQTQASIRIVLGTLGEFLASEPGEK
ncbi:MAG: hypothetical protein WCJ37_10215 [Syntrophus sp. (in: bacteria)]